MVGICLILSVLGDCGIGSCRLIFPDVFQWRCHGAEIEVFITRLLSLRSNFDRMIRICFHQRFRREQAQIEFQDIGYTAHNAYRLRQAVLL